MRRVAAARLQEAKQTIPHFYLQADCRVDALVALRGQLNAKAAADRKVTVTDLIVFAAARALRKVPAANSAWMDAGLRVYERVHVAIAVSTDQGLITPVVRDCDRKSLAAISDEIRHLSARARAGRLGPAEYSGGTFTVSNLGMFGITSITPIVNPPHSCILGVGAIEQRPVVVDGQVAAGRTMKLSLWPRITARSTAQSGPNCSPRSAAFWRIRWGWSSAGDEKPTARPSRTTTWRPSRSAALARPARHVVS